MVDPPLVRITDLAGRPRGAGFAADDRGTVVTGHEVVSGLGRLLVHGPGGAPCVVEPGSIVELPEANLALLRTQGLGAVPLPVAASGAPTAGAYVRIPAGGWREARVLGRSPVAYVAGGRSHLLDGVLELAVGTDGADALRVGGGAAGGPVLDARTGAVVAVLGTELRAGHRAAGFAMPLRAVAAGAGGRGPLAELLARNAATVPAYGDDLNLGGVLQLAGISVGSDGPGTDGPEPVERPDVTRELDAFTSGADGEARVLALVGEPGSGRTTELAAFAGRRAEGDGAAPTVWLRGADLSEDDASVAQAVGRTLARAGRIVAASREEAVAGDVGDVSAERIAEVARETGRPLVLLLDGPEEMPPVLAHRLSAWSRGTERWLAACGVRLVVACRAEYWEQAGALFGGDVLYGPAAVGPSGLPPCVRIGDLVGEAARRARERLGVPEGALAEREAGHPLSLRLLSEVRAALPGGVAGCPDRDEIFGAYLDLMCLRVAVRLAAPSGVRGSGVRRLAARVAGHVHEAARRSLGPGQGELDRESFEELFPWGARDGVSGWASAVLTEGVLVPAGGGFRFAHEEVADWIQGMHLDVDGALETLVFRRRGDGFPVPRHRAGPVVRALLLIERQQGCAELDVRLRELLPWVGAAGSASDVGAACAGVGLAATGSGPAEGAARTGGRLAHPAAPGGRLPKSGGVDRSGWGVGANQAPAAIEQRGSGRSPEAWEAGGPGGQGCDGVSAEAEWWGRELVREVLVRVADAGVYSGVLEGLAERGQFGGAFWMRVVVADDIRFELLRRAVVHDGGEVGGRCLDVVAEALASEPQRVQRRLTWWFDDERALPALPDATVADAAQALLHTHRHRDPDGLVEVLVECAHPRADELLAILVEEEPAALCRAVERWAHDERSDRRVAAAAYGVRVAPRVGDVADRELLRNAALALLEGPDRALHGAALHLLVRDPESRPAYLARALERFAAGDAQPPADALALAVATHPEPVFAAFQARLREPGPGLGDILRTLAELTEPAHARRAAALVRELAEDWPDAAAGHVATFVDRCLEHGDGTRAVMYPLVVGLVSERPPVVRGALARVLAAPGTTASRALRAELLDVLLEEERDPVVLDALLCAAARDAARRGPARTRDLVHRTGMLLVRTPEGAARFDRLLVELARSVPGFAGLVARWLAEAPREWAALVGPSSRRMIENLAGVRVPA
ncbi:serine protease [Streptomyces sp. NBC_01016]|uniref:trypsin-like peptidase domain-containing protein n=1 Tax=Streptomyces sp. NBC_01016 TaxID=2903720 RepID=UPI00224FD776|nr:serine protease [Streptomyces sp. NBC_01016]MCX4829734.1 serine protease [Streptomyces sp. NBC_01016]